MKLQPLRGSWCPTSEGVSHACHGSLESFSIRVANALLLLEVNLESMMLSFALVVEYSTEASLAGAS